MFTLLPLLTFRTTACEGLTVKKGSKFSQHLFLTERFEKITTTKFLSLYIYLFTDFMVTNMSRLDTKLVNMMLHILFENHHVIMQRCLDYEDHS